ncbi:MAG TPA: riboflavin synthase [Candidatus Saccharimonadales bacterium]|jgi:riboflavin synthase|nr:riboflavin synthase [Candidatus Saccharimonadales bacterium]
MFTGLIQETGQVTSLRKVSGKFRITINAGEIPASLRQGDSVAVSGVCLTAVGLGRRWFSADLAEETMQRTSLGSLEKGSRVNLELPVRPQDRMGGHVVQGHVDGVAKLTALEKIKGREDWRLVVELSQDLARYVVPQGSITVEGISLTVASISATKLEIAIIPHTYQATNLPALMPGGPVNIEVDVLAKYAQKLMERKQGSRLTVEELVKKGF